MAIIRKTDADALPTVDFGGPLPEGSPIEPMAVSSGHAAAALPEPEPVPDAAALPEPQPEMEPSGAVVQAEMAPEPVTAQAPQPVVEIPEELVQALYEQAVMAGIEEGKQQVFAELQVLQERYASALDQLDAISHQLADRNAMQLVTLSARIAERLVRQHLQVRPDHLLELVREVLRETDSRADVVIHCSLDDYEYLSQRRQDLASGLGESFGIQVVAEETLEYGDFRVETQTGVADARVATRIGEVESSMMAGMGMVGDEGV